MFFIHFYPSHTFPKMMVQIYLKEPLNLFRKDGSKGKTIWLPSYTEEKTVCMEELELSVPSEFRGASETGYSIPCYHTR